MVAGKRRSDLTKNRVHVARFDCNEHNSPAVYGLQVVSSGVEAVLGRDLPNPLGGYVADIDLVGGPVAGAHDAGRDDLSHLPATDHRDRGVDNRSIGLA